MKKFLALVLALTMLFSIAACGTTPPAAETPAANPTAAPSAAVPEPTPKPTSEPSAEPTPEPTEAPGFEADKNLFSVELTIPADFVDEGTTQESLDAAVAEMGYKTATLNSDGSVTYVMTKDQHNAMMEEIKTTIDEALSEMVASEDYPSIVGIEANKDYTAFDVILSTDTVGLMESFTVLVFYIYGGMYNAFNGTEVDNISVSFINQATGAVIETANSKDAQ